MSERQTVFSGIQPTGVPHLGNLIGAIRRWVEQQDDFESFFCIVDLHAMTLPWDAADLKERRLETGALLLASGIDPDRSTLFLQSSVREHSELAWTLACIETVGELRRMVQFKERSKGESESIGAGYFTYPILQAADILLYGTHGVPVGEDQRQHIELTRDLAGRFNALFGETFVMPEAWIAPQGARIMSLDDPTQKMSKSAGRPNASIGITDPPEVILRRFKIAVTDSGREVISGPDKPALSNLLGIFSALSGRPVEDIEQDFIGKGYGDLKAELGELVVDHLRPIRERYTLFMADKAETARQLDRGAAKASQRARETMEVVRERTGLGPFR
ncbi:MAG: tryptophan--tRNA ligase [Actinomycetota bacterium]